MALPRGLTILERSTLIAPPKPAPWHITTGVCNSDEIAAHVLDMNWSGYWFRHMCPAADILNIPCSDKRFLDDERPWHSWGHAIELKIKHRIKQIRCTEDIATFYLGNRVPRTKEISANAAFRYQRNRLHSHCSPSKQANVTNIKVWLFLPSYRNTFKTEVLHSKPGLYFLLQLQTSERETVKILNPALGVAFDGSP